MSDTTLSRHSAASGRFVLRLSPGLHSALRAAAGEAGLSLNDYCARRLAAPGDPAALPAASAVVQRAAQIFGDALLGVVVFGSWARGDAGVTSDVDVLVAIETTVPITRALYRRWDESPLTWDGHPVEVHLVHLPSAAERASGLWAEAAIDGMVFFERGLRVSFWLVAVRREILAGRLVRRTAHGQPYWSEVA